jgi:hypothetical protein
MPDPVATWAIVAIVWAAMFGHELRKRTQRLERERLARRLKILKKGGHLE